MIIGAAVAALLTAFLTTDASLYNALQAAASASIYGLFVGWIVGHRGRADPAAGGSRLIAPANHPARCPRPAPSARRATARLRRALDFHRPRFLGSLAAMTASEQPPSGARRCCTACSGAAMGLAPIAVLVLLFGQSTGSLRVAVTLGVLTIVMLAVSVAMRPSVEMLRVDIEHRVLDEVERVRVRSREDITTAARNTHRALSEKIQRSPSRSTTSGPRSASCRQPDRRACRPTGVIAQSAPISGYSRRRRPARASCAAPRPCT